MGVRIGVRRDKLCADLVLHVGLLQQLVVVLWHTVCVLEAGKGAPCMVLAATRSMLELNGFCVKYAIVLSHLMLAH